MGSAKEQLMELSKEKKKIEDELKLHFDVLSSHKIGMEESLVDSEGYPRNDIDVHSVRISRNRIIRLKNDLKEIMAKIESGLHSIHSEARNDGTLGHLAEKMSITEETSDCSEEAFAVIRDVARGSPSDAAGLKGQFTPRIKSLRYIWGVKRNIPVYY